MHLPSFLFARSLGLGLLALMAFGGQSFVNQPAQAQPSESGSESGRSEDERLNNGRLTVEMTGLRNSDGQICLNLFDRNVGFPNDKTAAIVDRCIDAIAPDPSEDVSISETVFSVTFENLSVGTYAVSVMHDENGDGDLNQGTFGIPTEGFGFSRNPEIRTSAPEFYESAEFVFGEKTTSIEMTYF